MEEKRGKRGSGGYAETKKIDKKSLLESASLRGRLKIKCFETYESPKLQVLHSIIGIV